MSEVEHFLAQLGRLDNRPETMAAMGRGLAAAWSALEEADGWPVIAEAVAEQRQAPGNSFGPDLASGRTANVGATVIHRDFVPSIEDQSTSVPTHRWRRWVHQLRRWVSWSAEVQVQR